ncbi:MAG: DUF86 domain-containing protein [Nitrospirae bacterium]|nr:DUF86 domain-containing protein [Nitrospirota bacterium]
MKVHGERVRAYLYDIKRNALDLESMIAKNADEAILKDPVLLKAVKYTLIEIAEAMANALQHLLARGMGKPVSGYIDTLLKARENNVIGEELFSSLKPFFEFRNALIHRYWTMDDALILRNCRAGVKEFHAFIDAIERFL